MKASYLLLAAGFLACDLLSGACVSGETVMGGGDGGRKGTGGSNNNGQGGSTFGGQGGSTFGGQGGSTFGGQGGAPFGGQGGAPFGGQGGAVASGCPRSVPQIDSFDEAGRGGPPTGGYFNLNCGVGSWYVYGDTTATAIVTPPLSSLMPFTSAMPGNGGTGYAAHVMGSGFAMYVGLGVNINSSGTAIKTADGSAYSGITFWAMGTSAGSRGANMIRVAVPVPASSSAGNGGTCVAATPAYCDGHWGKVIAITGTWAQYTVKWSELTLDMNSTGGATFPPASIIGFHWQVDGATTPAVAPASMNIAIDDLAFSP